MAVICSYDYEWGSEEKRAESACTLLKTIQYIHCLSAPLVRSFCMEQPLPEGPDDWATIRELPKFRVPAIDPK